MKYKSLKEYYWKRALWVQGIPWGLTTGIFFAIVQEEEVLRYFTSFPTILQILFFVAGGFLFAWSSARSFWKRKEKMETEREGRGDKE